MATTALAVAAARAEREIVEHLRRARATTPETAVTLPELRPVGERRLRRLVDAGVVRPGSAGHYLDETLYASYRADRRGVVIAVLVAVLALVLGVWLGQRAY
jgi:hypothetical protein